MSMTVDGVWKAGVWATTVWADCVWNEPSCGVAPSPAGRPQGGGRVIGYFPEAPKKRVVKIKWDDEKEKELIRLLKGIDDDYEKKRRQQFDELVEILRNAIHLGNQVSFSGFQYLQEQDIKAAKRKVQQEEEAILLLLMT